MRNMFLLIFISSLTHLTPHFRLSSLSRQRLSYRNSCQVQVQEGPTITMASQVIQKRTWLQKRLNLISVSPRKNYYSKFLTHNCFNNLDKATFIISSSLSTNMVFLCLFIQFAIQISLPTTVLLVVLGCGSREDPDDVVPGEFDFLSGDGLY